MALLTAIEDEVERVVVAAKARFARPRPYQVDPAIPHCGIISKPALRSYPSGHAVLGYSVGWVLARLYPEMAHVILARAVDYARSRELCGAHFPADTEASHVLGTVVAERLLADPRLVDRLAAARAELAAH